MPSTVDRLIHAAVDAMEHAHADATDEELLAACFTMALRMSTAATKRNPAIAGQVEAGARLLLMQCANERTIH